MNEWTTYHLSDLLLFSPRVFYRLFELVNTAAWPAHVLTLAIGLALFVSLSAPSARRLRIGSLLLVAIWSWLAWFYLANYYATINWAAVWLIPTFVAEAALLFIVGAFNLVHPVSVSSPIRTIVRQALIALALLAYPLLAPLSGRPLQQSEVFGIAPDPTAIATILWLVSVKSGLRWLLMVVPVLWCTLSGLTLWLLDDPLFWLPPTAAFVAVILARTGPAHVN